MARPSFWFLFIDAHQHADATHPFHLLRARGERPCHRTAHKCDECPPPHVTPEAQDKASYQFTPMPLEEHVP